MQVAHIAFTYLRLTLIYFHLECKILVKIPDSLLDSALALRGKEGDIVRGSGGWGRGGSISLSM